MKIFISYGHNDHTALVDALFDALIEEGHEPWKDDRYEGQSGIRARDDFGNVIYNAIDDCDFFIGFVTGKTLESRYCRDERHYAYNTKGSHFILLRLDGLTIREGNSDSYIDMDGAEENGGKINEQIFRKKMSVLFEALKSPGSIVSPSAKFEKYLKIKGAVQYSDFITMPARNDFVGREWLKQQCKEWVTDETIPCRLFVILGEAGTGKTAFVRHLAEDTELVRSVHVCVFDRPRTRNIKDTLKDLAYTLTTTNKSYYNYLKNMPLEQLDELDYDGIFEFLFIDPLKNEKEKYLLIIDGLDELEETTGLNPLIKVFRQFANKLNPNISILVTGRPEENIVNKLRTLSGATDEQKVLLDKENGKEDVYRYIDRNLTALGCFSEELQEKIYNACDGNFEYLVLLFEEAAEDNTRLAGNVSLPEGLSERYTQYLDRRMEKYDKEEELSREQKKILSVLCAAYEAMPLSLISSITGYDEDDVIYELKVLGSLVRKEKNSQDGIMVSFFSKGFRDYLVKGDFDNYSVNIDNGTKALAEYILKNNFSESDFKSVPYLDKHGFTHLLVYMKKERERVWEYIENLKNLNRDETILRATAAVLSGEKAAIEAWFLKDTPQKDRGGVTQQLKNNRQISIMAVIAGYYEKQGLVASSKSLQIRVLLLNPTPESIADAEKLAQEVLEIRQQIYDENPDSLNGYDLAASYEILGDIQTKIYTPESLRKAEFYYGKQLEICERIYNENPDYANTRGLHCVYTRLGNMAFGGKTQEDIEKAEEYYKKALELAEENYKDIPAYESRNSLAIVYYKLGKVIMKKSLPQYSEEAEKYYRKAQELFEEIYSSIRNYNIGTSLAGIYAEFGKLARIKAGTSNYSEEAEAWYRKGLSLAEELYEENPCYSSRWELAYLCETLGNIIYCKKTDESFKEAHSLYERERELYELNYRENPSYNSRYSLAFVYYKLGCVFFALQKKNIAVHWCEKAQELAEINFRYNPSQQNKNLLSYIYKAFSGENASRSFVWLYKQEKILKDGKLLSDNLINEEKFKPQAVQ